jgi:hypothetical protein
VVKGLGGEIGMIGQGKEERRAIMDASFYRSVFDLGARIGSLEGYLYVGKDIEEKYLAGWLDNIERGFGDLPADLRDEITKDYTEVLRKVAAYLERLYGATDPNARQAKAMVAPLRESGGRK